MPRQKKPKPVKVTDKSQRQKQKVSQNVKIVIGDQVKRAKRTYRKKTAQPKAAEQERPYLTPAPVVWSIPSPSPFSPEQITATIREQLNKQREQLPVLADPERMAAAAILRSEPQIPSIAKSVNQKVETGVEPEAPPLELNVEPSKSQPPAEVIKEPEQMMSTRPKSYASLRRKVNPQDVYEELRMLEKPRSEPSNIPRSRSSYINKADLEAMYFSITGEPAPKNMKVDELRKEVNRLKKNMK